MPLKFNKEVSAKLFRYVSNVDLAFNPFDRRSRAVREVLRQVQADRYQKSNPNLKINLDIHDRADAPTVQFKLVDGTEHAFDPEQYHANEMFFKVNLKTMQLDAEYELEGKSLDD